MRTAGSKAVKEKWKIRHPLKVETAGSSPVTVTVTHGG